MSGKIVVEHKDGATRVTVGGKRIIATEVEAQLIAEIEKLHMTRTAMTYEQLQARFCAVVAVLSAFWLVVCIAYGLVIPAVVCAVSAVGGPVCARWWLGESR